ncbi:uncharacterized protein LOC128997366 [Macrosteles quadrilineatus]|uniref:uncharacterized protein LOC128997366 n=1 Tax=Macrosteles quadrilineatus TaxID=74068 RepID=UPI0023E1E5FE|nr:uncharacterized protein LOC128997366 [Macrosteles quadrilineatus]
MSTSDIDDIDEIFDDSEVSQPASDNERLERGRKHKSKLRSRPNVSQPPNKKVKVHGSDFQKRNKPVNTRELVNALDTHQASSSSRESLNQQTVQFTRIDHDASYLRQLERDILFHGSQVPADAKICFDVVKKSSCAALHHLFCHWFGRTVNGEFYAEPILTYNDPYVTFTNDRSVSWDVSNDIPGPVITLFLTFPNCLFDRQKVENLFEVILTDGFGAKAGSGTSRQLTEYESKQRDQQRYREASDQPNLEQNQFSPTDGICVELIRQVVTKHQTTSILADVLNIMAEVRSIVQSQPKARCMCSMTNCWTSHMPRLHPVEEIVVRPCPPLLRCENPHSGDQTTAVAGDGEVLSERRSQLSPLVDPSSTGAVEDSVDATDGAVPKTTSPVQEATIPVQEPTIPVRELEHGDNQLEANVEGEGPHVSPNECHEDEESPKSSKVKTKNDAYAPVHLP